MKVKGPFKLISGGKRPGLKYWGCSSLPGVAFERVYIENSFKDRTEAKMCAEALVNERNNCFNAGVELANKKMKKRIKRFEA